MEQQDINYEFNQAWKRLKDTFIGFFLAFLVFLFINKCTGDVSPSVATTKIKEEKGKFESVKPLNVPINSNSLGVATKEKTRGANRILLKGQNLTKIDKSDNDKWSNSTTLENEDYIAELEKENEQLSRAYYLANNSIKKLMFEKANQLNRFSQTFDDEKVKIDVSGVSRGTVESIKAEYTIKERQIPTKEQIFALRGGLEVGSQLPISSPIFKGNIEFENKKGNSFSYGYDTNKTHWIGAKMTVFRIKK
jgi:hypothetical protein